jgi:hypothetical protein
VIHQYHAYRSRQDAKPASRGFLFVPFDAPLSGANGIMTQIPTDLEKLAFVVANTKGREMVRSLVNHLPDADTALVLKRAAGMLNDQARRLNAETSWVKDQRKRIEGERRARTEGTRRPFDR